MDHAVRSSGDVAGEVRLVTPREARLGLLLMGVRPAQLAGFMKRVLRVRRGGVTLPTGAVMWVDPASILGISLTGGGSFEPELSSLVSRVCAPGVAFLDVGANEGYFSILAAERGAEVLAVEPQPACAELIRRNATINNLVSRVRVENVALSDSEVPVRLWTRPSTNTGAASIHRHWRIGRASIEVPAMTLDRLLNERCADSKIDLAKIDTEGAELSILRGASTALARQTLQRIQIDFHETVVGARRADECRQLLLGAGYECRSVENVWIWEAPMIRG